MDLTILLNLALSLGIGLLVGLQRERKGDFLAGIRTFPLITLLGTLAALLGTHPILTTPGTAPATAATTSVAWTSLILPAGALALGILLATGGYIKSRLPGQNNDVGLTTEIAALVMYALGAYLVLGDQKIAVVLAGIVALLLHLKAPLHSFVQKLGDRDVSAIMQFVLVALVILPLLPNEDLGPYNALNPFKIWLVVVLVVGMSLAGYVISKFLPATAGSLVGGAVGGLVSSTAATVSYSKRSSEAPDRWPLALQAIMTANTVSVIRVVILLSIFAGSMVPNLITPLGIMAGIMALLTAGTFFFKHPATGKVLEQGNPAELKSALTFGALYAVVKLAVAWGKATMGTKALYAIGGLSGLTDMDAITLSISDMARKSAIDPRTAWRVILVAIASNLVFKCGTTLVLGPPTLKMRSVLFFSLAFAAAVALAFLYP